MNMKKHNYCIGLLFLAFLFPTMLKAQEATFIKANSLFESMDYAEAIPKYSLVLKKDSSVNEALLKMADCYRMINDINNAEKAYGLVIKKDLGKPIHHFYYAQALMSTGKYAEAENQMAQYLADERGQEFADAIKHIQRFFWDSAYYKINLEPFNSKQNDFSPALSNGKIVFTSSRVRSHIVNYDYQWTQNNFFKLYVTSKKSNGKYKKSRLFIPSLQKRFNNGPLCFSNDGKTVYFTRNNVDGSVFAKSSEGAVTLQLFKASINKKGNGYEYPTAFEYNNKQYNYAHPALNADGTCLYFSSDMPGGSGGMDIWMCNKEGITWGKPINLGKLLNTKGNEVFPTVMGNTLYFSSNGLEGLGGLDLFSVIVDEKGLPNGEPINMGVPINGPADDFGIAWNTEGKTGYFSSNRKSLTFDDDIYSFVSDLPAKQNYNIVIKDSANGNSLVSKIILTDLRTGEKTTAADSNGKFNIMVYPNRHYSIDVHAKNYKSKTAVEYFPLADPNPFEIALSHLDGYACFGYVYDKLSPKTVVDSAMLIITDETGTQVCGLQMTNDNGEYIAYNLKSSHKYTVVTTRRGYFTGFSSLSNIHTDGRLPDILLEKIIIGKVIKIENIYFDYKKSDIRPDAEPELDKIVTLMKENPDIIIEIGSHTDCRASAKYNMDLSDRRAKATVAYIVKKGIEPQRISGKGYGESELLNDCGCEGNVKSKCPEEEHAKNRRTEFKVTGFIKGIGNVIIDFKH
jgi:outer membrane protein OmpA-like peptidoglycan-associated protein/tetratricopeptide (TPR) repeat protein